MLLLLLLLLPATVLYLARTLEAEEHRREQQQREQRERCGHDEHERPRREQLAPRGGGHGVRGDAQLEVADRAPVRVGRLALVAAGVVGLEARDAQQQTEVVRAVDARAEPLAALRVHLGPVELDAAPEDARPAPPRDVLERARQRVHVAAELDLRAERRAHEARAALDERGVGADVAGRRRRTVDSRAAAEARTTPCHEEQAAGRRRVVRLVRAPHVRRVDDEHVAGRLGDLPLLPVAEPVEAAVAAPGIEAEAQALERWRERRGLGVAGQTEQLVVVERERLELRAGGGRRAGGRRAGGCGSGGASRGAAGARSCSR